MNIPKSVKIGGMVYKVTRTARPSQEKIGVDGEIDYDRCEILLRDGLDQASDYLEMVLIHEILHGVMFHLTLDEQDEDLIRKLGKGVHMLIKDNPGLFR